MPGCSGLDHIFPEWEQPFFPPLLLGLQVLFMLGAWLTFSGPQIRGFLPLQISWSSLSGLVMTGWVPWRWICKRESWRVWKAHCLSLSPQAAGISSTFQVFNFLSSSSFLLATESWAFIWPWLYSLPLQPSRRERAITVFLSQQERFRLFSKYVIKSWKWVIRFKFSFQQIDLISWNS